MQSTTLLVDPAFKAGLKTLWSIRKKTRVPAIKKAWHAGYAGPLPG